MNSNAQLATGVQLPIQTGPIDNVPGGKDDLLPALLAIANQYAGTELPPVRGTEKGWQIRTLQDPERRSSSQAVYEPASICANAQSHQQWHEAGILDEMPFACRVQCEIRRINALLSECRIQSGLSEATYRYMEIHRGEACPGNVVGEGQVATHRNNRLRHARNAVAAAYRRLGATVYVELENLSGERSIKTVIGTAHLLHVQIMALTQQSQNIVLAKGDRWVQQHLLEGLREAIFRCAFLNPFDQYREFQRVRLSASPMQEVALHQKTTHLLNLLESSFEVSSQEAPPAAASVH